MIRSAAIRGLIAAVALLGLYFLIITFIYSGWEFAFFQFLRYWYWITALVAGFGVQVGLFSFLRARHRIRVSGKVVAVSGTTSTVAMLSCCAHYLFNLAPLIGFSGLAALIGQYQTEIFGIGVLTNLIGIGYLVSKVRKNED
jgi:Cu+-exporting ATPase